MGRSNFTKIKGEILAAKVYYNDDDVIAFSISTHSATAMF